MQAQKQTPIVYQMTAPGILAFPNLFEPRKFRDDRGVESGEAKYDFQILMPVGHQDIQGIQVAMYQAAAREFPGAVVRDAAGNFQGFSVEFDWCLHDGEKRADNAKLKNKDGEFYRGFMEITSRGKYPPGLGAAVNGKIQDFPQSMPERLAAKPFFYGGVHCIGKYEFVAYKVGNNKPCVTAYPQGILSLNTGDRRSDLEAGEGRSASLMFAGIVLPSHVGAVHATGNPAAGLVSTVPAGLGNLI